MIIWNCILIMLIFPLDLKFGKKIKLSISVYYLICSTRKKLKLKQDPSDSPQFFEDASIYIVNNCRTNSTCNTNTSRFYFSQLSVTLILTIYFHCLRVTSSAKIAYFVKLVEDISLVKYQKIKTLLSLKIK